MNDNGESPPGVVGSAPTYDPKGVFSGCRRVSATSSASATSGVTSPPRFGSRSYASIASLSPRSRSSRAYAASKAVDDAGRISTSSPSRIRSVAMSPRAFVVGETPTVTFGDSVSASEVAHARSSRTAASASASASTAAEEEEEEEEDDVVERRPP